MHKQLFGRVFLLRSVAPHTHADRRASGYFFDLSGKLVEVQAYKESRSSSSVLANFLWRLCFFASVSDWIIVVNVFQPRNTSQTFTSTAPKRWRGMFLKQALKIK